MSILIVFRILSALNIIIIANTIIITEIVILGVGDLVGIKAGELTDIGAQVSGLV